MQPMNITVILPAAGSGSRFAQGSPSAQPNKLDLDLVGKPVFLHAVELFNRRVDVGQVILAVAPDRLDDFRLRFGDTLGFLDVTVVAGGQAQRWQTVANALRSVDAHATHIAVHDAARPLTRTALIDRVFAAAARYDAVVPAMDVGSTLKRVEQDDPQAQEADPLDAILGAAGKPKTPVRRVVQTVDRLGLVAVQTPQVFKAELLRRAYRQIDEGLVDPLAMTDDAQLIEALGEPVRVVQGEPGNLKITYPGDAELATALMNNRTAMHAGEQGMKRLFGDDDDE